ncbi:MAG TPA: hypothetical protein VHC22_23335 [Pirellulales bacterium]|nr:hypothetical protein [Pirellulales bacterium]
MMQYTHTLIAQPRDFSPYPTQVSRWYRALEQVGAAPFGATIRGRTPSGQTRLTTNPFTGKQRESILFDYLSFESLHEMTGRIAALGNYAVTIAGQGPPVVAPMQVEFDGQRYDDRYDYAVRCLVHAEPVTTSDPHDDSGAAMRHGGPCVQEHDVGVFRSPTTWDIIEVVGGGRARFWIEFEFGKGLFPTVGRTLDLLDHRIVDIAVEVFNTEFVQGCRWG